MEGEDPLAIYEDTGQAHRKLIEELLPSDWNWEGKRVLDFGCGVGRVIRQFAEHSREAEFWGCDIDAASIEWLEQNLSPPFHFFQSDEEPALPQGDGFFDLIYALSVYTHLTDHWAGWLLEHHRVLNDGGLMVVTFLGEGMAEALIGEPWDEGRIGMNALTHGHPWDLGGPTTLHSPWWLEAHWGRAFEIVELRPHGGGEPPAGHGIVVLRKRPVSLTEADLTRLEPDEPREIAALRHHEEQLRDETIRLSEGLRSENLQRTALEERLRTIEERLAVIEGSRSWRLTAPLRRSRG